MLNQFNLTVDMYRLRERKGFIFLPWTEYLCSAPPQIHVFKALTPSVTLIEDDKAGALI